MFTDRTKRNLKRTFEASLTAKIGLAFVFLIVVFAIFAPLIAPYDPARQDLSDKNKPPVGLTITNKYEVSTFEGLEQKTVTKTERKVGSWEHPLGTGPLGRDVLSRVIYGARISFMVGIVSTLLGFTVGTFLGLASGYFGGWFDDLLMRLVDIRLSIPGLILAIALLAVLGSMPVRIPDPFVQFGLAPSMPETIVIPLSITIAIGALTWEEFARVARSESLSLREENYVKAALSSGASNWFIIRRHLFPNAIAAVLVLGTIRVAVAILLESTLSFLGFTTITLSWGYDIARGRGYLATSWWIAMFPGLGIVIAVMGINLLGDWLRDALDPTLGGESEGGL